MAWGLSKNDYIWCLQIYIYTFKKRIISKLLEIYLWGIHFLLLLYKTVFYDEMKYFNLLYKTDSYNFYKRDF